MATDEALEETAWSQQLYRTYRDSMPQEVRAVRDFFVVRGKWDIVAAGILDWAMENRLLLPADKSQAMVHARAGMFGRSSAHYEQLLSAYRPPIAPVLSSYERRAQDRKR